ncbi:hypothetical protein ACIGW3_18095 [Streptomyces sp. NPDC053499]|uniref:hypothetical protein n=1 Tax=Streptomyces sp. NPDC053499 TaxID=3365707 RepID=UPI0037CE89F6
MRRLTGLRLLTAALCVAGVLGQTAAAHAGDKNSNSTLGTFKDGKAAAGAGGSRSVTYSGNGSSGSNGGGGNLSVPSGDWAPPPCWYAPTYSPKELKEKVDASPYSLTGRDPNNRYLKEETDRDIRHLYSEGEYDNYNLDKQGEGKFWAAVPNPNEKDAAKRESCTRLPFWVKNGERPDVENAISPEILSKLAYAQVTVPGTRVKLNPDGEQTVNLPTWVWLDKGKYRPLSVRASVDLGGGEEIWARTTVEPDALKLSPGTENATLHPSSGECGIKGDGSIGSPYKKGSGKKAPPCGVTYLRATQGGSGYTLQSTLTWKASWEGSEGAGGDLPTGEFGGEQDVTVQEIQAIN